MTSQCAAWMRATSWIVWRVRSVMEIGGSVPYPSPIRTLMHVSALSETASTL
jgi:hypothetical protein